MRHGKEAHKTAASSVPAQACGREREADWPQSAQKTKSRGIGVSWSASLGESPGVGHINSVPLLVGSQSRPRSKGRLRSPTDAGPRQAAPRWPGGACPRAGDWNCGTWPNRLTGTFALQGMKTAPSGWRARLCRAAPRSRWSSDGSRGLYIDYCFILKALLFHFHSLS